MAAHGEKSWPSVGNFNGRPRGGSHGRRQIFGPDGTPQISTAHVWTVLLMAFAVADLLVIASSFDGLHLLHLSHEMGAEFMCSGPCRCDWNAGRSHRRDQ